MNQLKEIFSACRGLLILALCLGGLLPLSWASSPGAGLGDKLIYDEKLGTNPEALWPKELKTAFEAYWFYRSAGQGKEAFRLEAPFFQEMVLENRYANLLKGAAATQLIHVLIRGVERKSDYLYVIQGTKKFSTGGGQAKWVHFADEWVFAGEAWYHVMRDRFMFPEAM